MSEPHDWKWLRNGAAAPCMTMASYLELSEDLARSIEVNDGMIMHRESPSESHIGIQQNLAVTLQDAIDKHDRDNGSCHRVQMDIDVLLDDATAFTFRRPDVTVYRCLPTGRRGQWTGQRSLNRTTQGQPARRFA